MDGKPELNRLRRVFKRFRRSQVYAAARLGVVRSTITLYLQGRVTSARLDAELPKIADEIESSHGECITGGITKPSVRSRINRLRGRE